MLKREKPLLRKTPLKRSQQPLKRTAIKRKVKVIEIEPGKIKKILPSIKNKSSNVIPKLLDKAERVVNASVRKAGNNNGRFICIACGEDKPVEEMQAGHFISKTYAATRFHKDNIWPECSLCNCFDVNHLIGYEIRLIEKIGQERFDQLHVLKNKVVNWDRSELEDIIKKYS